MGQALRHYRYAVRNLELQPILAGLHDNVITMKNAAVEDLDCKRILHQPLDRALQRPRPIRPVVPRFEDRLPRVVGHLERDLPIRQHDFEILQPQIDDVLPFPGRALIFLPPGVSSPFRIKTGRPSIKRPPDSS
jgi:hypothetical protein